MLNLLRYNSSLSLRFATRRLSQRVNSAPSLVNNMAPNYERFSFNIEKVSSHSKARTGSLKTPHGTIETPNFVFCATKAAMKAITPAQLEECGTQIILSNTYHLMIRPGADVVQLNGGLQKFTGWGGPMLTDSGGYQIFSMGHGSVSNEIKGKRNVKNMGWTQTLIKLDESGATFRSYVDGEVLFLTPEKSIAIQKQLGADLVVVLDECTPFNVDKDYTAQSMHRSHRWADRSLAAFMKSSDGMQALYGIVQGGIYYDMRDESTAFVNSRPFFGSAIGGSLGDTRVTMHSIVEYTRSRLRNDRPVHLLGIGGIRDIFHGVKCGIDTFDCVHPSRIARHGGALVKAHFWNDLLLPAQQTALQSAPPDGEAPPPHVSTVMMSSAARFAATRRAEKLRIKQHHRDRDRKDVAPCEKVGDESSPLVDSAKNNIEKQQQKSSIKVKEHMNLNAASMRYDLRPIDENCTCYTCRKFSRSYLHHLFSIKESLGGTLVTIHNVQFMNKMMQDIRKGILTDTLEEVEKSYVHESLKDSPEL